MTGYIGEKLKPAFLAFNIDNICIEAPKYVHRYSS